MSERDADKMSIDKSHSIFWKGDKFNLFILKLESKDVFVCSIIEGDIHTYAFLSGDEFSSFVCEMLKYCLDLPEVARAVPCPIDLTQVYHGCLQEFRTKIRKRKGEYFVSMDKFDERFLKYHGYQKEWKIIRKKEMIAIAPIKSMGLQTRDIAEFRINGKDRSIKIQTEQNPALKIKMTMKKSMLDAIDKALELGLHHIRQEFIASAIRHELEKLGIKH